ncbi:hypothetical protein JHK84_049826 [Glycine max]|nr:hypothetical protein JHK87_049579 [Glycine soja]KAG4935616.1 hypothetical protein JHK85_050535 [Glycine max]KAG5094238.1 hypothetical protein JHK84_049826 [Glycine max]
MSCEGVVVEKGFEDNKVDAGKWVGEQVIPLKDKVQVTVDLRVLESRYNRKLGIFQIRVDFLLSNGEAIASSTQP